jgi:hypothetical protein
MSQVPPSYAEYPRPSQPFGRGPGVYVDAISEAWTLVRKDLGNWIAGTLLFIVLAYAMIIPIALITAPLSPKTPGAPDYAQRSLLAFAVQTVLNIIPMGIMNMLMAGLIGMGVRQARGEYINVGMIFEPFRRFLPNLGTGILVQLAFILSLAACIIPAFFVIPVLFLAPTVAYLKEVSPGDAISMTFNACKRHWMGLFGLLFITGLIAGLGVCACGIGLLFTYPIYFVVLAIHYRAFFESASV